jgi:hypothetical protein
MSRSHGRSTAGSSRSRRNSWVRSYDLDRIRMELPGTSVEHFKRSRRRCCGLRTAFRFTDVNSTLQALERVPV